MAIFKTCCGALKAASVEIIGWALILAGIAMIALPGPGILGLFAGVVVLSNRYHWARRLKHGMKDKVEDASRESVATKKRIAFSTVCAFTAMGIGAYVLGDPTLPAQIDFSLLGFDIGPKIPGAGLGMGISLIVSGIVGLVLLAYSKAKHGNEVNTVPSAD